MKVQKAIVVLTMVWSFAATGCFGVRRDEPTTVSPTSPILLRPLAADLRGKSVNDVVTPSETTVVDVPLTSRLIRQVATEVSAAVVSIYTKTEVAYRLRLSGQFDLVPERPP